MRLHVAAALASHLRPDDGRFDPYGREPLPRTREELRERIRRRAREDARRAVAAVRPALMEELAEYRERNAVRKGGERECS